VEGIGYFQGNSVFDFEETSLKEVRVTNKIIKTWYIFFCCFLSVLFSFFSFFLFKEVLVKLSNTHNLAGTI